MKYKIVITVTEPNPNFSTQLEEYNQRSRYGAIQTPYPSQDITTKMLETVLDEAEFMRCRDAILSTHGTLAPYPKPDSYISLPPTPKTAE